MELQTIWFTDTWRMKELKNQYGNHVFITGASSGIGRACAVYFAKRGCQVIGVSRNCKEGKKSYPAGGSITMRQMDVTDEVAVKRLISEIPETDIVILAAGMGVAGAIADTPIAYAREQMEVNYFGVLNVVDAILPKLHEKRRGLILVIGSVAGKVSIPMQSQYSASKYALEAYVDALRLEEETYGIRVALIEPGDTRTGFTDHRKIYLKEGSAYNQTVKRAVGKMEQDERNGKTPEWIARTAWKLAGKENPPARVFVGLSYKMAWLLIKLLPDRIRENVIRKMYLN